MKFYKELVTKGHRFAKAFGSVLLIAALVACGGGEGGTAATGQNTPAEESQGDVFIGITDAEGDFVNYAVDILSIKLTKANGEEVETLPVSTQVDFAQYVELTEFITGATIPSGRYIAASILFDYSNAEVLVEVDGQAQSAEMVDTDGNAVTSWEVSVNLDRERGLVIAPGIPAHLTLDFDLEASHTVNTDVVPPQVTVSPVLLADVELENPKPHRVRGLLTEVDVDAELIVLDIRPFHRRTGRFGSLHAYVGDDTAYEIDGVVYQGAAGLATMDGLSQAGTWVIVYGALNTATRQFEATEIYAGSSVPGSDQDAIEGVVTARSGDNLTVHAKTVVLADGNIVFNRVVEVVMTEDTVVTKQLSQDGVGKDAVSVGQRVVVIGQIQTEDGMHVMDGARQIRMKLNQVSGEVVTKDDIELVLDVKRINGRPTTMYDFAGTGADAANDVDPDQFQIDIQSLTLDQLEILDPVKVRGFFTPFGSAPADYMVHTVIKVSAVPARLVVKWVPPSVSPFLSQEVDSLVLNLDGAGALHHVRRQWINTDLLSYDAGSVALSGRENDRGVFAIRKTGEAHIYTRFTAFVAALNTSLDGSSAVRRLSATGRFDSGTAGFLAKTVSVVFANARSSIDP